MSYIGKTPTPAPLTSSDITDGIITTTKIADANVTNPKLISGNQQNFRNIIINGDMSIAQRGTSFSGIGDGGSQYTLDRFKWSEEGATDAAVYTITQSTTVPSGQGFAKSFKVDCTTADTSVDANNIQYVGTAIEGQNLQYLKYGTSSAENMVLSFWVKSNKTGTYGVALINNESTEKLYSQTYTILSADTWEKKTLSYVGDTSNGFDNDNGNSLLIQWYLVAGSGKTSGSSQTWGSNTQANRAAGQTVNLADSTANEWFITGIQLEAGTTASDFELLPFDVQLNRCKRYFEKSVQYSTTPANGADSPTNGGANGWIAFNTSNIRTPSISFKCEKRATPSIVIYRGSNSTSGNMGWFNGSSWQDGGNTINKIRPKGFYGAYESNSTFTQFSGYLMDFSWTADSEL